MSGAWPLNESIIFIMMKMFDDSTTVLIHILCICVISGHSYVRICFIINTTILQLSSFITCDEYVYSLKNEHTFDIFHVSIVFCNRDVIR